MTFRSETPPDGVGVVTDPNHGDGSEPALWTAAGRGEVGALREIYRRHGDAAYALARRITGDRERAEEAVVEAFVGLPTAAVRAGRRRPLRVEVLDAARRCAGSRAVGPAPGRRTDAVPWRVRDVMALATATHSDVDEIASVMALSRRRVHLDMLTGLRSGTPNPAPVAV